MSKRSSLRLHEQVMLLALRNDRGTVAGCVMYQQAVGGAILAELILEGRVRVAAEGRKAFAVVENAMPLGDPVLDECLARIRQSEKRRTLLHWVQKFAGLKSLKHRVASGLVANGVLREEEDRVLLLFSRRVYPELDPAEERRVIERINAALFSEATVDPATAVLIAVAQHSGLLKANFDRKRLKERRERIASIAKGDAVGRATKQAIEAVQSAVMVAAIMPAIMAGASN